jgi:hypothetical protein
VPKFENTRPDKRVEFSKEFLSILDSQKRSAWHGIVTLDEHWLYIRTEHELIWLLPGEDVPEREPRASQSEKMMLTIEWNPSGSHIVNLLGRSTLSKKMIPLTYLKMRSRLFYLTAPNRTVRIDLP